MPNQGYVSKDPQTYKGKGGLPSGRRSFLDFFCSFESCSTLPGTPNFLTWKIFIRFLHTHNFKGKARLNHLWRKALFFRRFTRFFLKTSKIAIGGRPLQWIIFKAWSMSDIYSNYGCTIGSFLQLQIESITIDKNLIHNRFQNNPNCQQNWHYDNR